MSGFVTMLPFLEETSLFDLFSATFAKGGLYPTPGTSWGTAWITPAVLEGLKTRPPVLVCPSDTAEPYRDVPSNYTDGGGVSLAATGSYALCHGSKGPSFGITAEVKYKNNGLFTYAISRKRREVTDGLSHTFAAGETIDGHLSLPKSNIWTFGSRLNDSLRSTECPLNSTPGVCITAYQGTYNGDFASRHPGGGQFVFADGHVVFVSDNVSPITYTAHATISGGETVSISN